MKSIGHKVKRKETANNSMKHISTRNSESHQLDENSDYENITT